MILRHSFEPRDNARLAHLCGSLDEHLRSIERLLDVSLSRRNEFFRIEGPKPAAEHAMNLLLALYEQSQRPISAEQLQLALVQVGANGAAPEAARDGSGDDAPTLRTRRADLVGRTPNQVNYLRNILGHDITFGVGPAGTGKTFLAVACAVDALERSAVQRVILTRPAVEAGERLGFLPGTLSDKIDPYLRPLYDALHDMVDVESIPRLLASATIEVAPLGYMRGRTLNDAFIVLDEAQNTSPEQMKMFLTRLGFGSKMVVTGDVTQIDLPSGTPSGLKVVQEILEGVEDVHFAELNAHDVVRHALVGSIVEAYGRWDQRTGGPSRAASVKGRAMRP